MGAPAARAAAAAARGAFPPGFTFGYLDHDTQRVGPQPKQWLAHICPADILFYGGAVGGGKSEMAIVEAIRNCLAYRGCQVAVFRRKHTELIKSLIPRFLALVPKGVARFNKQDHAAYFQNGSILWFCHCQHESNVYDYQSAQWLVLIIDEASHFTQFQIDYLSGRVRCVVPWWRKRIILTSNPGNVGHGMLKRRFVRPLAQELGARDVPLPLEIWRPLPLTGDPTPPDQMMTRCFIPAFFSDNEALRRSDPHYLAKIWALGGDKARQLAEGDWDANDSMIVGPVWRESKTVLETDVGLWKGFGFEVGTVIPWHVIHDRTWRPVSGTPTYGSVDYGYGSPWSAHLHAGLAGGHSRTFAELYGAGFRDKVQAQKLRQMIEHLGSVGVNKPEWIVMDPSMWNTRREVGLAKSIAEVYEDELGTPLNIPIIPGAKGESARLSRPNRWLEALAQNADGLPNWTVTTACPELIRTVPEVPWDEDNPNVEDDESENHCYEDVGRFFEARPHHAAPPTIDPFAHLQDDPISLAHAKARDKATKKGPRKLNIRGLTRQ